MRKELLKSANLKLKETLGSILEPADLVRLCEDLEERIFQYFEQIFSNNVAASKTRCLTLLETLGHHNLTEIKIENVDEIQPHLLTTLKQQYCSTLEQYLHHNESILGPYKSQAVSDYFRVQLLEQMVGLAKQFDTAFDSSVKKDRHIVSEYTRQVDLISDLVTA